MVDKPGTKGNGFDILPYKAVKMSEEPAPLSLDIKTISIIEGVSGLMPEIHHHLSRRFGSMPVNSPSSLHNLGSAR